MTTAIASRQMSDPFAPNPAGRFVSSQLPNDHVSMGLFTQPVKPTQRAMSMAPQPTRRPTDDFGTYTTAAQPSAARTRASQPPALMMATPVSNHTSSSTTDARRNRQSHNPAATLANASPPKPEHLTDEYVLHPSVWAWKQEHPNRPMVGFGTYVLLQTLGEGEFGKVKLGVHTEHGVQVAIKLIRRGSLEDETRAEKVEREVSVLKRLRHPNIVRAFDVIDTEKYIGIVLEYAGGGELFDHILANKYLKERDAARLFAQLISGVDYLHRKHIVHRDLKLENLLLDKNRNIIITDFGFANRFEYETNDLMSTSCGSPCYAAPELVVSEGLYVGTAVDIWSCGVILYAMLAGYLPFDDDPDNPDGDNINLLYRYIMSTELHFPDHVSDSARYLLQIMLVPNPDERCRIEDIMDHPWLASYRELFNRTVEEHEYVSQVNLHRRHEAAKREIAARRLIQQEAMMSRQKIGRSQSLLPGSSAFTGSSDNRRVKQARPQSAMPNTTTMPEYLNQGGRRTPRQSLGVPPPMPAAAQTSPVLADAIVMSQPSHPASRNRSLVSSAAPSPSAPSPAANSTDAVENVPVAEESSTAEKVSPSRPSMSGNRNRHTIQVEYDEEASYERVKEVYMQSSSDAPPSPTKRVLQLQAATSDIETESSSSEQDHTYEGTAESIDQLASQLAAPEVGQTLPSVSTPLATATLEELLPELEGPSTPSRKATRVQVLSPSTPRANKVDPEDVVTPRAQAVKPLAETPRSGGKRFEPMPARAKPEVPVVPADMPLALPKVPPPRRERYRKGMSLDKFGLGKLLGATQAASTVDLSRPPPSSGAAAASIQEQTRTNQKSRFSLRPGTAESDKNPRRKTLQSMVNRSNSIRGSKTSVVTPSPVVPLGVRDLNPTSPVIAQSTVPSKGQPTPPIVASPQDIGIHNRDPSSTSIASADQLGRHGEEKHAASSSAAKKVMDWFRRKSVARETLSNIKQGGVRSDSASSFVQVSDSPIRAAREESARKAAESASNPPSTSTPAGSVVDTVPQSAPVSQAQPQNQVAREEVPMRVPFGSVSNKENIAVAVQPDGQSNPNAGATDPVRAKSVRPDSLVPIAQPAEPAMPVKIPTRRSPPRSYDESKMRIHTGLVDQSALSSKSPKIVMSEVVKVLQEMGMDVRRENEYRLKCTRARRRKSLATMGLGLGNVISVGASANSFSMAPASSSKLDARGLPLPSTPSGGLLSSGGLKGMLLRRGSSYSSTHPANIARSESDMFNSPSASSMGLASPAMASVTQLHEPVYGEHTVDNGDEIKFVVELCRMKNLPGLYLLNIKRLRGSVWGFKFIYQTVLERCETLTH